MVEFDRFKIVFTYDVHFKLYLTMMPSKYAANAAVKRL